MTEEQKAEGCPYDECKRAGRCRSPFFSGLCYHEKMARAQALSDAKAREAASKVTNGDRG